MWNDNAPIYRQLKERVIGMMLDGLLKPGDALPSVRQIAAEYQLNPITVSRAYQELADEELVEKRRGLGMYMTDGAREKLLASERERFLTEEWPAMSETLPLAADFAATTEAASLICRPRRRSSRSVVWSSARAAASALAASSRLAPDASTSRATAR